VTTWGFFRSAVKDRAITAVERWPRESFHGIRKVHTGAAFARLFDNLICDV
jgi:hypothetical protein